MKEISREEQLEKLRRQYERRKPEGKTVILNELCEEHGYHRKHAIRLMNATAIAPEQRRNRCGPAPQYESIIDVLERIWKASEQPCGKRLVEALPLWMPFYEKHYEPLTAKQRKLLIAIGSATADRLLSPLKADNLRGLSGTRPGTLLRQQIALTGVVWNQKRPGFLETDSVAHCGGSLAGNFVWSLTYTDMASSWTEGRAVYNKGAKGVVDQTQHVEENLPFALLGMDFDNGTEWLNWHLIKYLQNRAKPVQVTRSRPYCSNDNAHVEQKNYMWPRQLLGYGRLEEPSVVPLINSLFVEVWGPLHNFFLPSMKLVKKWRVGSKWKRLHDEPKTAYQRLALIGGMSATNKRRLRDQYESLDPFKLHEQLDKRLRPILKHILKEKPMPEDSIPGQSDEASKQV